MPATLLARYYLDLCRWKKFPQKMIHVSDIGFWRAVIDDEHFANQFQISDTSNEAGGRTLEQMDPLTSCECKNHVTYKFLI
jgi:hypothetical protein